MKKLWRFRGGVRLAGFKKLSNSAEIKRLAVPGRIVLPLRQHIGEPAEPVVEVGDYVYKGQVVATSGSFISASVHASTSGTVTQIANHAIPHQSGVSELCIFIEPDGKDQWYANIQPNRKPDELSAEEIRVRIREAGIVGLGGAVFPSAAKLKPTRQIDTLLINGVECEPYITCDDALMRLHPVEIVQGVLLLRKLLNPSECIIAIEDNKPEAIKAIREAIDKISQQGDGRVASIDVVAVPTIFPAGGEKQLIRVLTGKEVPAGGLPYEVGVVCLNVGTTAAIRNAIYEGVPLISRYVTVSGPQSRQPANYEVLIGTPIEDVIASAGGTRSDNYRVIMGGPMMGQWLPDTQAPVIKATNCILLQDNQEQASREIMPCIRCGSCATACPMKLLPQQLYWHAREKAFDKLEHYHLADCIECGCCSVVCPSQIPLVHYFRFAKSEQKAQQQKTRMSEQSRLRTQMREARLERIKREQEERKARRKAERLKKKTREQAPAQKTEQTEATME